MTPLWRRLVCFVGHPKVDDADPVTDMFNGHLVSWITYRRCVKPGCGLTWNKSR
jgi:hypothetical protein